MKPPAAQATPAPTTVTTSGSNSPAIVGNGNTVNFNSDDPPGKKPPQKKGQSKP